MIQYYLARMPMYGAHESPQYEKANELQEHIKHIGTQSVCSCIKRPSTGCMVINFGVQTLMQRRKHTIVGNVVTCSRLLTRSSCDLLCGSQHSVQKECSLDFQFIEWKLAHGAISNRMHGETDSLSLVFLCLLYMFICDPCGPEEFQFAF